MRLPPGYRIVTPGKCPACKSANDWIIDRHGRVVCGCQSNESPISDATYDGVHPLTKNQYKIHLELLTLIAGPQGWYGFGRDTTDDEHAAHMAVAKSGLASRVQGGPMRLTERGKYYARHRGIMPSNYPYPEEAP